MPGRPHECGYYERVPTSLRFSPWCATACHVSGTTARKKMPPVCEGTFGNDSGSLRTSLETAPGQGVTTGLPLASVADDSQNLALGVVNFQSSHDGDARSLPHSKRRFRRAKTDRSLPLDEELVRLAPDYLDRQRKCWQGIVRVNLPPVLVVVAIMAITGISVATTVASPREILLGKTWTTQGEENTTGSQVAPSALTGPCSPPAEGTGLASPSFRNSSRSKGYRTELLNDNIFGDSGCSRL